MAEQPNCSSGAGGNETAHRCPSGLTSVIRSGWLVLRSTGPSVVAAAEVVLPSPPQAVQPPSAQPDPVTALTIRKVSSGTGIALRVTGSSTPLSRTWTWPDSSTQATRASSGLMVSALTGTWYCAARSPSAENTWM